ncbi:hypothetical protein BOX15_Mlig009968g1, partial [Macrostomum lignano]
AEFGSGNLKFVERSSLDSFSEALRFLHFDKAKEIIDKELDQNKSVLSPNWRAFLNACSELCSHEKSYYSLSYLQSRAPIFTVRKENLRESYRCLSAELQRVSRASSAKLVSHVSDQLVEFVQARLDLMDVYAALASQSLAPNQQQQSQAAQQAPHQLQLKSRDFVIRDVECLMQRYRGKFHHPKLAGISTCFEDETEILFHLLNASGRINNLYFLESMLSLHEVSNRLVVWQDQAAKYKLHKAGQPNLLHWFHRLYSHLLSKYTLCFCSVLAQQSPSGQQQEMVRMAQQRQDPEDLLMKLIQLHKRTDCVASLLIFNATAQSEPYLGHGYYLPGLMGERPVGKDGYPVIFAFPPAESAPPASAAAAGAAASSSAVGPAAGPGDMTNILMTVASENWGSGGPSAGEVRVRFFSDDKLRRSYCIGYAEPRLHLALVLEHRGTQRSGSSQKDRALERQVVEFCAQLAGCGLYGMLRTGGK